MTKTKKQKMTPDTTPTLKEFIPMVPKEAINLWQRIKNELTIIESEESKNLVDLHEIVDQKLSTIGFPLTLDHILISDFLTGQSRYVRNDDLFVELVKYAIFVKSKQLDIEFRNCDNLHWLTGILSELNELETAILNEDKTNIIEEIGDLFFFVFSYAMEHNILFGVISYIANELTHSGETYSYNQIVPALYRNAAVLCDIEKGTLTSGKGFFKTDLGQNVLEISQLFVSYAKTEASTSTWNIIKGKNPKTPIYKEAIINLIKVNMNKLGGRYVGKFTAEEDHNRDTTKEKITMEKLIN